MNELDEGDEGILDADEAQALISAVEKEHTEGERAQKAVQEHQKAQVLRARVLRAILLRRGYHPSDEIRATMEDLQSGKCRFVRKVAQAPVLVKDEVSA